MLIKKIFALAPFLIAFSLSILSCGESQSKDDNNNSGQQVNVSDVPDSNVNGIEAPPSPKVYSIKSVTKSAPGKAHDFTWEENGKVMSFSELTKNKVVFLNFWGTWCPPCRAEIPAIVQLDKELDDKDFIVIGIPLERDNTNAPQNVANFAKSRGIQYRNIVESAAHQLDQAYGGIRGVPTTYIIDKNGNIGETLVGARSKEAFLSSIKRFMQ